MPTCALCPDESNPERFTKTCKERALMEELGLCFGCAFWEIRARHPEKNSLRINGWAYSVDRDQPSSYRGFVGMGGRRFDIELADGRIFTTHNLWSGGQIPAHFRDRLPDNAKFVDGSRELAGDTTCWNPASPEKPPYPSYFDLAKEAPCTA